MHEPALSRVHHTREEKPATRQVYAAPVVFQYHGVRFHTKKEELEAMVSVQKKKFLKSPHESQLYSRFSHLYDKIFSQFFCDRITTVIHSLNIEPGATVLEVGIGTGLSLAAYPSHCEVTGIDVAPGMLKLARQKIMKYGWTHFRLQQMDALQLEFADNTFDYVTSFHVMSVVPDPVRMMQEIYRVCKPNGTVVIINHFRNTIPLLRFLTGALDPLTRRLGWSTALGFSDVFSSVPISVEKCFKTSRFSLFTVVQASKKPFLL
jgi:phosphatidylethanolamine/phosphatidyl-N-methylethanolamine N-methyltransferase